MDRFLADWNDWFTSNALLSGSQSNTGFKHRTFTYSCFENKLELVTLNCTPVLVVLHYGVQKLPKLLLLLKMLLGYPKTNTVLSRTHHHYSINLRVTNNIRDYLRKTNFCQQSPVSTGIKIYNKLPVCIREIKNKKPFAWCLLLVIVIFMFSDVILLPLTMNCRWMHFSTAPIQLCIVLAENFHW